jgi:hypothetical protein
MGAEAGEAGAPVTPVPVIDVFADELGAVMAGLAGSVDVVIWVPVCGFADASNVAAFLAASAAAASASASASARCATSCSISS